MKRQMHFLTKLYIFWFIICCLICNTAADEINLSFQFSKKPPFAALVYIPTKEKVETKAEIDQLNNAFTTKLSVVSPQSNIIFKNSDDIEHNVFANDLKQKVKFDVGLMSPGSHRTIDNDWHDETIVRVGCKIHPKMRTYIANVNSNNYKVIEPDRSQQNFDISLNNIHTKDTDIIVRIPKYQLISIPLSQLPAQSIPIIKKGKQRGLLTITRIKK